VNPNRTKTNQIWESKIEGGNPEIEEPIYESINIDCIHYIDSINQKRPCKLAVPKDE
jgi:hypothetical protein